MFRAFNDGCRLFPCIFNDVCSFRGGLFARSLKSLLRLHPRLFPALIYELPAPDARLIEVRSSLYLRGLRDTLGFAFRFENSLNLRLQRRHAPLASRNRV